MMMASLRGTKSYKPCPACLIPKKEMSVVLRLGAYARRTTETMRAVFEEAQTLRSDPKEELLMQNGLRDIEVLP